jgi:chromosome segregation ATPase
MTKRDIPKELTLLATEVDSLGKALALANAERAREGELRRRAEADAQELRQRLRHANRRAKAAERELADISATTESAAHTAESRERDLLEQLDQAEQAKRVLRHEVEQTERERRSLELNLREVLGNLRHAAQEAHASRDATLVPPVPSDNGW